MNYIKVKWVHNFADEPIWLYGELDAERWEVRKVEIFPDGSYGYASKSNAVRDTQLGLLQTPSNEEIAKGSQFEVFEIAKVEFEEVWLKAISNS